MLYRDHRGGYKESMDTVQEFNTLQQLYDHINRVYKKYPHILRFKQTGYDPRNNWNAYDVLVIFEGGDDYVRIGQSNGVMDIETGEEK